jgi:hypothetical protein
MWKVKIDKSQAIQMRANGDSLRKIGEYFGTSAEAVRQALQRAEKNKKEQKKMASLLASTSSVDITKIIDDWSAILEAAKKGIALESEVAGLKERLSKVESSLEAKKSDRNRVKL